jgi:hypothetical protein
MHNEMKYVKKKILHETIFFIKLAKFKLIYKIKLLQTK